MSYKRKPQAHDWSQEEITRLREYAKSGMSQREAALQLGRTFLAVQTRSFMLCISWKNASKPWTASEIAILRKYAQTHTKAQVAAMLEGRTKRAVEDKSKALKIRFQKHGMAHNRAKLTTEQIAEAFALRKQGQTYEELGKRYEVNEKSIWFILNFATRYRESLQIVAGGANTP